MIGLNINSKATEIIQRLKAEEAGIIVQALISKANGLELPQMDGAIGVVFDMICGLNEEGNGIEANHIEHSNVKNNVAKERKRKEATEEERAKKSASAKARWERVKKEKVEHAEHIPFFDECEEQIVTVDENGNEEVSDLFSDDGTRVEKIAEYDSDVVSEEETVYDKPSEKELLAILKEKFDMFWKAYPRKQDKKKAFNAFKKINPDDEKLQRMIDAVEYQKHTDNWVKENGMYIPMPTTWLNGERWEDEMVVENVGKKEPKFKTTKEVFENIEEFVSDFMGREN